MNFLGVIWQPYKHIILISVSEELCVHTSESDEQTETFTTAPSGICVLVTLQCLQLGECRRSRESLQTF